MAKTYTVTAAWDDDAKVWVATSDDVPGLVTEARTLDALVERVHAVAPELLDDNAHLINGGRDAVEEIHIHVVEHAAITCIDRAGPRPLAPLTQLR